MSLLLQPKMMLLKKTFKQIFHCGLKNAITKLAMRI